MADFSPFLYLILPLQKVRSNTVRTEIKTSETDVPSGRWGGQSHLYVQILVCAQPP